MLNSEIFHKTKLSFGTFKSLIVSAVVASGSAGLSMLLTAITGLYLVRLLSTENYARYTIVIGAYQTIQMLGDSGIPSAVMNEARNKWKSPDFIATALNAGRKIRKVITLLVYSSALIFVTVLTEKHGLPLPIAVSTSVIVILAAWVANESSLLCVPLYLHQKILKLQSAQIAADLCRLIGVFTAVYFFRHDFVAVTVFFAALLVRYLTLLKSSSDLIGTPEEIPSEMTDGIRKFVSSIRPVWIYTCFSGSITIFLASIFGATLDIAAVGGLARLCALTGIGGFVFNSVVTPRFSRELDPKRLRNRLYQSLFLLAAINTVTVLPFMLFPSLGLKLIGGNYAHFQTELQITCVGSWVFGMYAGIYSLALGRGNLVKPWFYLGTVIVWQIFLFVVFDLHSLRGVLWIGALTPAPGVAAYLMTCYKGIRREEAANLSA